MFPLQREHSSPVEKNLKQYMRISSPKCEASFQSLLLDRGLNLLSEFQRMQHGKGETVTLHQRLSADTT